MGVPWWNSTPSTPRKHCPHAWTLLPPSLLIFIFPILHSWYKINLHKLEVRGDNICCSRWSKRLKLQERVKKQLLFLKSFVMLLASYRGSADTSDWIISSYRPAAHTNYQTRPSKKINGNFLKTNLVVGQYSNKWINLNLKLELYFCACWSYDHDIGRHAKCTVQAVRCPGNFFGLG